MCFVLACMLARRGARGLWRQPEPVSWRQSGPRPCWAMPGPCPGCMSDTVRNRKKTCHGSVRRLPRGTESARRGPVGTQAHKAMRVCVCGPGLAQAWPRLGPGLAQATAQLHHCITARLYNCTTAPLHHGTTAPLRHCATAPQATLSLLWLAQVEDTYQARVAAAGGTAGPTFPRPFGAAP